MKVLTISLFLLLSISYSQVIYNHPEIDWQTMETDHFFIHFYSETERTAREGAFVAESIYPHVTQVYNCQPRAKTHIIFLDTDDFSNGIAYPYDNKIEIWASPLDFELRGSHRWLQNVITHEFTHIVSFQKAKKYGNRIPGGYLQWIGYEKEKRKDVLYGYPNSLVSYPVPGALVPPWLAEGISQYMFSGATHDFWDTHRDMILRDRTVNNNLLTYTEMSTFGKRGTGNESTYNSGFAFVRFIVYKYGEESLERIITNLSNPLQFSTDSAIRKAIGISGSELWVEFKQTLEERYRLLTEKIKDQEVRGKIIIDGGSTNIHPVWSPDSKRIAYLSNEGKDFFSQTDLYIYSLENGRSEKIVNGVFSAPAWTSSGKSLYYCKKSKYNRLGSRWFDLYEYSFSKKKETRLTRGARAFSPILLPGDSLLVYLAAQDGTHNVYTINLNSNLSEQITDFNTGEQLFGLAYDSTRHWVMFDYVINHFRNTATLSLSDTVFSNLLATAEWDERDLTVTPDGGYLYACDRNGIFNLCYVDPLNGHQGFITNVLGGAFMPDVSRDGKIVYSLYEENSYKIALLDSLNFVNSEEVGYGPDYFMKFANLPDPLVSQDQSEAVSYKDTFSPMFLFPKVMMDYGVLKPGFYFFSSEIINRLNVFGSGSINSVRDLDTFLIFEMRDFYPTLFAEVYFLTRHTSEKSKLSKVYDLDFDVRYRLFQLESGIRLPIQGIHEVRLFGSYQNYRASSIWWIGQEDLVGKSGVDYYIGKHAGVSWTTHSFRPTSDYMINPNNGWHLNVDFRFENDKFLNSDESLFELVFNNYFFFRLSGKGTYHLSLPGTKRWTLTGELQGGWMSETEVDSFFYFFAGGMPGLMGYPFYSLEGNRMLLASLIFRLPIVSGTHLPMGPFILQNIVLGFVGQTGDAWDQRLGRFNMKRSIGIQIRFGGFSFYNYPTGISVELHRGLDKFSSLNESYGEELRTYFTLLFGF